MVKGKVDSPFLTELWTEIRPSVTALLGDLALFIVWLGALTLVFAGLRGLSALGYRQERIDLLETLHYYAYLPVYVLFLLDLILKVGLHIFSRKKVGIR